MLPLDRYIDSIAKLNEGQFYPFVKNEKQKPEKCAYFAEGSHVVTNKTEARIVAIGKNGTDPTKKGFNFYAFPSEEAAVTFVTGLPPDARFCYAVIDKSIRTFMVDIDYTTFHEEQQNVNIATAFVRIFQVFLFHCCLTTAFSPLCSN